MTRFNHTMILLDHSMIEMCRLKNVVIFVQTILGFALSRKIINTVSLYLIIVKLVVSRVFL